MITECDILWHIVMCRGAVLRQLELLNATEQLYPNSTHSLTLPTLSTNDTGLELHEVLCAPPVTNQLWQMASGYIGAALMLVMAVYGR